MSIRSNEDVLWLTERFYALVLGHPTLLPHGIVCGCGSDIWLPRFWKWHERRSSGLPYRCDVNVKCSWCAVIHTHGVVISNSWWGKRPIEQLNVKREFTDLGSAQQQIIYNVAVNGNGSHNDN
jgi:hypothetical protein